MLSESDASFRVALARRNNQRHTPHSTKKQRPLTPVQVYINTLRLVTTGTLHVAVADFLIVGFGYSQALLTTILDYH